MYKQKERGA